jgi:4-amino-4-deoxy-L-arabinose transferase-like glycosyltransferase
VTRSMQISLRTSASQRLLPLIELVFLSRFLFIIAIWMVNPSSGFIDSDTPTYVIPAQSLLHGSFSSVTGKPEIARTPGYPLLLLPAVGFHHWMSITLFENLLLAMASAWLIWQITTDLFPGSKAAWWAVVLYCFEPVGFLYSAIVLTETLFCAQLLLFAWLVIRFLREPTYSRLLLAALALGWATYTRPVTLYLGFSLILVLLLVPASLSFWQRLPRALLFPLVFALTLAPWIIRNAAVAGYPGFSPVGDQTLYFYSAAAVKAKLEHRSFADEQRELGWRDMNKYFQMHPEQLSWSQAQIYRFMRTDAQRTISNHLGLYALIHARSSAVLMFAPNVTEILKAVRLYPEAGGLMGRTIDQGIVPATLWLASHYPIAVLALFLLGAQLLLYYVLSLIGFFYSPTSIKIFFGFVVLYLIFVSGTPSTVARYRSPIMPFVCITAGAAIAHLRSARKSPSGDRNLIEPSPSH